MSSQTISTSANDKKSVFNILYDYIAPKDNAAIFTIKHHGKFTANFIKGTPLIPTEYIIPLYGVIVSSIVGWSIPSIIGSIRAFNQRRRLRQYQKEMDSLYLDNRLDEEDISKLDRIIGKIRIAYTKGKISEQHYNNLKNEISMIYEEIYKKKIDSLKGKNANGILLDGVKENIKDAYAKGKINEQHYKLLNEKISDHKNNQAN